jgi:hypothetical protein
MDPTSDLAPLLQDAFHTARATATDPTLSLGSLHSRRSRAWVAALHARFAVAYPQPPIDQYAVFSKGRDENRKAFGLTELLFDLVVGRVDTTPAVRSTGLLTFIAEAIWQVESEFARNSRSAVIDCSKLVLGSARNKLMVVPDTAFEGQMRNALQPVAVAAASEGSRFFLARVPHPDRWEVSSQPVMLWELINGEWSQMS